MDTLSAFYRGEAARRANAPMNYFDGVKIKELMESNRVTEADIFLAGDRGYTNTTVKLENGKLSAESVGVDGSIWATPTLEINGEEFEVGTPDETRMTIEFI